MGNIGVWELIIIAVLLVFIFGSRKLPELGRGLGLGLANFRRAVSNPDRADLPKAPSADDHPVPPSSDKENNN